jgi:hypothetical protein
MKEFLQWLQDVFPLLRNHPRVMLSVPIFLSLMVALYRAKGMRKRICAPLCSRLCDRIFATSRWLYVYQDSQIVDDWKYYTSEVTGKGRVGDDIIWTLVSWPSLKPKDSFRVPGAVGMVNGIHDSQAKLKGRWNITHNPDSRSIGFVHARGMRSKLRRASANVLKILGSFDLSEEPEKGDAVPKLMKADSE